MSPNQDLHRNKDVSVTSGLDKASFVTNFLSKPLGNKQQTLSFSVPGGKLEEGRPSPLVKFNGFMQDFSSGSEGEKESPPPEWDVPLKVSSRKSVKRVKEPSLSVFSHGLYGMIILSCSLSGNHVHFCICFLLYQKQTVFSRSLCRP